MQTAIREVALATRTVSNVKSDVLTNEASCGSAEYAPNVVIFSARGGGGGGGIVCGG